MWIQTFVAVAAAAAELTVHCHNQADVSAKTLHRAKATAREAFRRAGVNLRWTAEPTGAFTLVIATPADGLQASMRTTSAAMAFALLTEQGQGTHARIAWPRIKRFAVTNDAPVAMVLGYAMAHEIGHLAMGSGMHAKRGLMKSFWSRAEISQVARGQLAFLPQEHVRMRRHLADGNR
jgi:hypothetical protein